MHAQPDVSAPGLDRSRILLAAVALAATVAVTWSLVSVVPDLEMPDGFFVDFHTNVWEPGRAILDGRSPLREYTAEGKSGSVYPPAAALTTLPFALPPYRLAVGLWVLALVASVVAALLLCGVRDWRCFALALLSPPVVAGLAYGNVSLLLVLAVATTWHWRDRPWRVGPLLGIVIAGKLFLWPLLIWLLLTRRRPAAAVAAASTALASLIGWAAVAFRRIEEFSEVTRRNASEFVDNGVSVASFIANLGAPPGLVAIVTLAAGTFALIVAWHLREDDLACLSWVISAALLASPIVWVHYYALMLVPLALATPRLSRAWLLPYVTAPQLTFSVAAGGRVFDAATGVAFVILTARHSSRRDVSPRQAQPRPGTIVEPSS